MGCNAISAARKRASLSDKEPRLKTALVHYWLVRMRGGESVFRELMGMHPEGDVFTNVFHREGVAEMFNGRPDPATTWVNKLPWANKFYPLYMPLMPGALELFDLSDYELIVSSESGPAKWVISGPNTRHICYVHTPMRYLWDQRSLYRQKVPSLGRPVFDAVTRNLRFDDVLSAMRVDDFVANSTFVASRIKRYYRREATVIHPPVRLDDALPPSAPEDFYLFTGHLVSYKRLDLAIEACHKLKRRLVVLGDGPGRLLAERAASPWIEYRGWVPRHEMVSLMNRCRALLFPGVEDFGIVPVEVMAAGRPVVGLKRGGLLDTVEHGRTGWLYEGADVADLERAILDFEAWETDFQPQSAIKRASGFSAEVFREKWRRLVDGAQPVTPGPRTMAPVEGVKAPSAL